MKIFSGRTRRFLHWAPSIIDDLIQYDLKRPVNQIKKHTLDMFKPLKSYIWYGSRELMEPPLESLAYLAMAVIHLVNFLINIIPGTFITLYYQLSRPSGQRDLLHAFYGEFKVNALLLVSAIAAIGFAAVNLVIWPFRILSLPIRVLITHKKGAPMLEDSKGFREDFIRFENRLKALESNPNQHDKTIAMAVARKVYKAECRGQKHYVGIDKIFKLPAENIPSQDNLFLEPRIELQDPQFIHTAIKDALAKRDSERPREGVQPRI